MSEIRLKRITKRFGSVSERIGTPDSTPDYFTARTFADRYTGECTSANFMNDAVVARSGSFPGGKVDIAVFNASEVAAGVPAASPLTFNDMYGVMPYADVVFLTQLTGAQLKDIVRSNAKRLVRPEELQGAKPLDTGLIYRNEIVAFLRAAGVLGAGTGAAKDGRIEVGR